MIYSSRTDNSIKSDAFSIGAWEVQCLTRSKNLRLHFCHIDKAFRDFDFFLENYDKNTCDFHAWGKKVIKNCQKNNLFRKSVLHFNFKMLIGDWEVLAKVVKLTTIDNDFIVQIYFLHKITYRSFTIKPDSDLTELLSVRGCASYSLIESHAKYILINYY